MYFITNVSSPRSHHGPHALWIEITASSKAMRVYAELYLYVMGVSSVMGVYTLRQLAIFRFFFETEG